MLITVKNKLFGLKRELFRYLIRHSSNKRPDSYPYITGDTFRIYANYIHDDVSQTIKPEKVEYKQKIFVGIEQVEYFFKHIHPDIKNPYILITHNGDIAVDDKLTPYIDEKIINWFGQNVNTGHEKVIPIPIGIENTKYYCNGIVSMFNALIKKKVNKQNRILYGFKIATNVAERQVAYDYLVNHKLADGIPKRINPKIYLNMLNKYKFVASPPGNGIDCHRTWEALYLGAVPIVKSSPGIEYFKKLGYPMWIVNDWTELNNVDESFLQKKYEKLMNNFDSNLLKIDFWIEKMNLPSYDKDY
ncbi:MAG: hypothetical protein DKM50_02660 [Candidatus Margulisiibacteriota bacterium]|nr:MAG: hypothetical protein A2X43_03565 [Candidatus Margulisbacteria bacterium GWD2_39_127]OGI02509.1 MAG: hypothetical protein A2X42_07480 [Candidatus Margulisbacteria bacterium GWF2_38_17]OGI11002.1 MAG: hypothetical protein A2X41_02005 [Candidatus Margulisbacteria bacterium GWE2_39_32]PZM83194.1 MAG: hypothetical protein DKM50_02660 [Candidatus Margulisiibacteriota bacterium]HAR62501.1 hypothetical protein [Candidatus Margulisiibacteriota bacterium]